MRKTFAIALVLTMVLGFAGTAFAALPGGKGQVAGPAFSDIAGHKAEAEVTLMAALGIMNGDTGIGGKVRPNDGITRAEFAKMIVGGLGKTSTATGLMGLKPSFKDEIPTWAWGWVNAAFFMGLMKGDDKGVFHPADNINYAEAVTVLVRAVRGHEAQLPAGMWPYNYLFYAVDEGFTGPVDLGFPRLPAPRGDVARLLFAMMQVDQLDKDGDAIHDSAMLAERIYEGLVTAYNTTSGQLTIAGTARPLADKVYIVGASSYDGLMNLIVRAVTDAASRIGFIQVTESANVYAGVFSDLEDVSHDGTLDTLNFEDGRAIGYTGPISVTLNQDAGDDEGDLNEGDACVVSLNEAGKAVHVAASRFDINMDFIGSLTKSTGGTTPTDTHVDLAGGPHFDIPASARVTINSQAAGRDDLAKYDVAYIATKGAHGATVVEVKAIRQVVQGTVKATGTSYPGPKYNVIIEKTSGGTVNYRWNTERLGTTLPTTGTLVKLGLNEAGELYVPIGFISVTPYVLVKGFSVDGTGKMAVTVDSRGLTLVYPTTVDLHDAIGDFGLATIDGATNTITLFTPISVLSSPLFEVLSVNTAGGTMTVENLTTHAILFVSSPSVTIYKTVSGSLTYAGFAGIAVGTELTADSTHMIWVIGE